MKANYDFHKGRRGVVVPASGSKVRITIRLDRDIVDWFRSKVEAEGGGKYQAMLNEVLHAQAFRRAVANTRQLEIHRTGFQWTLPLERRHGGL